MRKLILYLTLVAVIPAFCGCSGSSDTPLHEGTAFDSNVYTVPSIDGYETLINDVFYDEDHFCISIDYYNTEDPGSSDSVVLCVDDKGNLLNKISMESLLAPACINNGVCASVTDDNKVVFSSAEDGKIINIQSIPSNDFYYTVFPSPNGFALICEGKIVFYSNRGDEESVLNNSILTDYATDRPIFNDGTNSYIALNELSGICYYRIEKDMTLTRCETGCNASDYRGVKHGDYIFGSNYVYKISMSGAGAQIMADFDCIDEIPESKPLKFQPYYYPCDDLHFAKSYAYNDNTAEVLLYSYDPNRSFSDFKTLKIGGYGASFDLSLRWAVYKFNKENDTNKIRAVIDEYSDEYYFDSGLDGADRILELTRRFLGGDAPDILYGYEFDFDYLGKSGVVQDMSQHFDDQDPFVQSIYDLMQCDDKCYRVASSFRINGYWGRMDIFKNGDVSLDELVKKRDETSIPIFSSLYSHDISDLAIRYGFKEHFGSITESDIRSILEFSATNGLPPNETIRTIGTPSQVCNNEYLIAMCSVNDFSSFAEAYDKLSLRYIGFPSVFGSVHIIVPQGMVGISAGTKMTDKCYELIDMMLCDEVQTYVAVNQQFPVNEKVWSEFVNAENTGESDNMLISEYVKNHESATVGAMDELTMVIRNIDVATFNDWGLYNLICEETDSMYLAGRDPVDIAATLYSRLDLYYKENYS